MMTKEKINFTLFSTMVCGLVAHAFVYFNINFSHDSVMVNQYFDVNWQTAIGRWGQYIYLWFRGGIYNPFLTGVFSLLFLACACFLIILLFKIEKKTSIFLICGVLATNSMLTYANATYIYLSDIYMFSLLCSVAAIYIYRNQCKFGVIFSTVLLTGSMSLYQSFVQVAILLFMFLVIHDLMEKRATDVIKESLGFPLILVLSLVLYYAIWQFRLEATGLSPVDTANSAAGLTQMVGLKGLVSLIIGAYKYVFKYFLNPSIYNAKFAAILTVVLVAYSAYLFVYILIKKKPCLLNTILIICSCALLPLGGNMIYIMAKGEVHGLMIYSFFMFFVWAICLYEQKIKIEGKTGKSWKHHLDSVVVYGVCLVLVVNGAIYANQIYVKKDLEFKLTYATLNRVIDRIEQTEGYSVWFTPVAFVGTLEQSPIAMYKSYFDYSGAGVESMFSATYHNTYRFFLIDIMGYPINIINYDETVAFEKDHRVQEMGCFPAPDSCKMIDGTVVVKFSEE